jgi:uncharacterized membrane protein
VTTAAGRITREAPPRPVGMRRYLPYTLPGLWFALVFACLSFTPSLLPRSGLIQGLVCGINAAIGYGLGVFAAAAWRAVVDRAPRPPRSHSWTLLAVAAAVALPVAIVLGRYWQDRIRELMGVPPDSVVSSLLVLPVAPSCRSRCSCSPRADCGGSIGAWTARCAGGSGPAPRTC